jgi:hypothetical protein
MATSTRSTRLASLLAAGGLALAALSACSGEASDAADAVGSAASAVSSGVAGGDASASTAESGSAGESGGDGGVDCSGTSCSVTLPGDGTEVQVLGTAIKLGAVETGRATLGVGGKDVSCSQGEKVSAGPLTLECTTVSTDRVTLKASLG